MDYIDVISARLKAQSFWNNFFFTGQDDQGIDEIYWSGQIFTGQNFIYLNNDNNRLMLTVTVKPTKAFIHGLVSGVIKGHAVSILGKE
jgi:hypothetical protein